MTAARLIDTARLTAQLAGCTAQLTAAGFPDGKPAAVCPAAGCAALRALWVELSAPLAARCVGRSRGAGCGAGSTRVTAESFLRKQTETRILRGRELAEKTPQKRKRVVAESFPRKQTETRLLCGGELSKKTLQK